MNAAWLVAGVEKVFKRLTIDENVSAIGTWSAVRNVVEDLAAFSEITVEREGIQIFGGRIERPGIDFSRAGSEIRPGGFDYTIKLTDYLTPQSSIVDTATAAALATLISNTPFSLDIIDTFGYITDPLILDTTCEFLYFDFYNTCIEFLRTEEDSTEVDTDVNVLPDPEYRAAFFYDGVTRREYAFYGTGGTLRYRWSDDCGVTWSAEIDTTLAIVGNNFSVAWYDSKVYVFLEDAGGNTDFYRGTINDGTGAVTLGLIAGNIFANWMRSGPFFTPNGNIWVVENTGGNNDAWESINDGVAWNNRFTGTEVLWYMLPKSDGEDMWLIEFDVGNTHLELWDWDKSLTTQAYVNQIRDFAGDLLDHVAGCQNAEFKIHLAYCDNNNELFYRGSSVAGVWGTERSVSTNMVVLGTAAFHICADRYLYAYIGVIDNAGFRVAKASETTWAAPVAGLSEQGPNVSAPATGLWDGEVGCFFSLIGFDDDLWFYLMDPVGIRIDGGLVIGYFLTNTITAGGTFVRWGYCAADGVEVAGTDWSVRLAADDSLLGTGGQKVTFDMDIASGNTAETSIKIRADMTDLGTDPYIEEISVSEKVDEVTFELDFEDVYTGMLKWAALSGAEFWLDSADVLHVAYARGSDKSDRVILKNGKTGDYPEVEPNIKVVSRDPDWAPFANAIKVIGAAGPPRIETEVKDQPSIDEHGEHWYCHRDPDIQTVQMAETVGAIQLALRNTVIDRIRAAILDEYDPTDISIGDNVWVVAEFGDDVATKLNASMRVVSLTRSWGPDGEQVSLELINLISASEYWAHLVTIADLTRWVTA